MNIRRLSIVLASFGVLSIASGCTNADSVGEAPLDTTVLAVGGDRIPIAFENDSASAWGNVAYGANDSFFFRTVHGLFTCDNATFGDPLVGTEKACYNAGTLPAPPMATQFLGNSPAGNFNWSEDLQGIAHDANNWFITDAGFLWKIPITSSLATDRPQGYSYVVLPGGRGTSGAGLDSRPLPTPLPGNPHAGVDLNGYDHFGDLDAHSFGGANVLFIPMQGGGRPIIAIFDADTLEYVTATPLPADSDVPGVSLSSSGAFVAAQVLGGLPSDPIQLWVSGDPTPNPISSGVAAAFVSCTFDERHEIIDPNGNWVNAAGAAVQMASRLTHCRKVMANDGSGKPVTDMYTMQGGTFNEDGTLLYTLNGYCDTLSRLHVFRIGGGRATLWDEAFNPGDLTPQPTADRSFVFESQLTYPFIPGCAGDEPEGLDYFDTRGRHVEGVPDSQLHALLGSFELGDDDVWVKHYKMPDAAPQPILDFNLALNRLAWGSSDIPGAINPRAWATTGYLATDGNTDGNYWDGSLFHSDYGYTDTMIPDVPAQSWFVDLGAVRTVNSVSIFNRTDCCSERLAPYNVLAFDADQTNNANGGWYVISNHTGDDTAGVVEIDIPLPQVRTQYVMIAKTDPNYLQLAEVKVMGH